MLTERERRSLRAALRAQDQRTVVEWAVLGLGRLRVSVCDATVLLSWASDRLLRIETWIRGAYTTQYVETVEELMEYG